jgi:hypothetical protein
MAGISYVFTITRVAQMLGEDADWLQDICDEMDPEDGRLTVLGPGEEAITAFTRLGIDISSSSSRYTKPPLTCSVASRHPSDHGAVLTGC